MTTTTIRKRASDDLAPVFDPKLSKADERVSYAEASAPAEQCGKCRFYVAGGACRLVEGTIAPSFSCSLWTPRAEGSASDAPPLAMPFREPAATTTWAMRRLEREAARIRASERELTHEQAVVKASERFPKLVRLHRAFLRAGIVEASDDERQGGSRVASESGALAELREAAREIRQVEPELTEEQAMVRASDEHPDLVRRYREESGFLRRSAR